MEAVHLKDKAFELQFPDYKRWLSFKRNEIGGTVPWRRKVAPPVSKPVESNSQLPTSSSDGGSSGRRIVLEPTPYYYGKKLILNRPRRIILMN